MLILLPPSEGKTHAGGSTQLQLARLSFAQSLTISRLAVLKECMEDIRAEPTAPAIDIYSGVLYQSLNYRGLSPQAQKRAQSQLLIFSALFGVLRPLDLIPYYSKKIKNSQWKLPLALALDDLEKQLIVDCRSSTYVSAWKSNPDITVAVRVFQDREGVQSVITHMSKKFRGELIRILLQGKAPKNPQELRTIAEKFFRVELHEATRTLPWQLDLIIPKEGKL